MYQQMQDSSVVFIVIVKSCLLLTKQIKSDMFTNNQRKGRRQFLVLSCKYYSVVFKGTFLANKAN